MKKQLALVLLLASPAWAQAPLDLCAGRVQDKGAHPMLATVLDPATLKPLPIGKPAVGVPYLDPSFGTIVTRIAAPPTSENDNAIIKTGYSTMPAWNTDESLLILWHREKGHELYEGDAPHRLIGNLGIRATDIEHVFWCGHFDICYTTRKNQERNQLVRLSLKPSPQETVEYDFSGPPTNCPLTAPGNRFGFGANPEVNLGPRGLIGLVCGTEGQTKILYSLTEKKVLAFGSNSGFGPVAPIPSPTDQEVLLEPGYVLDVAFKLLRRLQEAFAFEHSQVGQNLSGGTKNTVAFDVSAPGANDAGTLVVHRLADASRKVVIGPATGYPFIPNGTHISATGPTGWIGVGTIGTRAGQLPLDNEIILANTDTGKVCRVAHSRTWAGTCTVAEGCYWGYWSETHLVVSPSGTRIAFTSDGRGFAGQDSGSVDTYVVDLRQAPKKLDVTSTCDLASLSPTQVNGCKFKGYQVVP